MKKLFRFLLIAVLTSLVFGQLTRITLSPQLAFYLHDFLILFFLSIFTFYQLFHFIFHHRFSLSPFSTSSPLSPLLKKIALLPKRRRQALLFLSLGLLFLLFASATISLISFLYALRFFAYLAFLFIVFSLSLFTQQEWQKIWLTFFFSFAAFGLFQYFIFPDTSFLENLGWDDHYYRLIGTWFDPAFSATCLIFGLFYSFFFISSKKVAPWFLFLNYFFLSLALVFTYSRSGFLALLFAVFLYLIKTFPSHAWSFSFFHQKQKIKKQMAKKTLLIISLIAFFLVVFFALSAHFYPSDSTNLLRTNSINLRWQTFTNQIGSFSPQTWIIGDGFFVPRSSVKNSPNSTIVTQKTVKKISSNIPDAKKTTPFPDNLFLLLISFFGLPLTIIFTIFFFKTLHFFWHNASPLFYFLLVIFIVAQFNQTVFQPFVLLTFGLLASSLLCVPAKTHD